jgi:hypothetical protein
MLLNDNPQASKQQQIELKEKKTTEKSRKLNQ